MQLLFSFDRGMRVEKILMQTLAYQLSSTLMRLLFSFDRGTRAEKIFMQTLACQLSSILVWLGLKLFYNMYFLQKNVLQQIQNPFWFPKYDLCVVLG